MQQQVPVTIVTGWDGAGTARLIGHLARTMDPQRVAVVASGPTGRGGLGPAHFVEIQPEISERSAGCSCCAVRSDLVRVVSRLSRRKQPPDWILVEAAGWTDPVLAAQTFLIDPGLARLARLDAIVTTVDGPGAGARIASGLPPWLHETAAEQVAMADRIVISGATEATAEATALGVRAVASASRVAQVVVSADGCVEPSAVLGVEAFGPAGPARLGAVGTATFDPSSERVATVRVEAAGPLDGDRLEAWLDRLHEGEHQRVLRLEGVVAIAGMERRLVCQGVGSYLNRWRGRRWTPGEARRSRLVVAGRDFDGAALSASLSDCVAA